MIGIIPSLSKTFEIMGDFNSREFIEGKLDTDGRSGRLYMFSLLNTRSNPATGFFPVWDGKKKYISQFSNEKYLDKDAIKVDIDALAKKVSKEVCDQVLYNHRKSENEDILEPILTDGDNMFTQCIKGVLNVKKYTLIDLVDMSFPKLTEKTIQNYYSALVKITFMRPDKWNIWLNTILHMEYDINVFKEDKRLISYKYPKNKFDTGVVKYDNIIKTDDDPLKKIVKILMIMENISKNSLRSEEVDDYTINNMMTTLSSSKAVLSSQLFSRFIRMANLSYEVNIYEGETLVFEYKEGM